MAPPRFGRGKPRQEAGMRIENAIQAVLNRSCKRLDIGIGIDYGDLDEEFNKLKGITK